jgi:hypothetical protein
LRDRPRCRTGGAEPLEQQRVAVEVVAKQVRAASALGEEQGGGLDAELAPSAGNTDFENGRRSVRERHLCDKRGMSPA